jgi:hypothetical protein
MLREGMLIGQAFGFCDALALIGKAERRSLRDFEQRARAGR